MKPGVSGWTPNSEQHPNQMNTSNPVYSKRSTALMTKDAHHETALYSQIPAVTFDLGDEWDTWGDFDDENLVHASEISTNDACTANAGPQIQQPGEYYTPKCEFRFTQEKDMEDQIPLFHWCYVCNNIYVVCAGFAAASAPLFLSQSQVKPSVTSATAPLRSGHISSNCWFQTLVIK